MNITLRQLTKYSAWVLQFMNVTNALADATRVRVLLALRKGELCACQLTELFGLAQSTMSKHFYLLKQAGLVDSRKDGRWVYYKLPSQEAPLLVQGALAWVQTCLAAEPQIIEDTKSLKKILKLDPAEVCKRQCRK